MSHRAHKAPEIHNGKKLVPIKIENTNTS